MRISDWSSDVCSSDLDDRGHDCGVVAQMRNVADEGTVDLQRVDRELATVRKRGKAGAEIVQRDVDPIVVELADGAFVLFRPTPQEDAFADLQLQFAGGDSGLLDTEERDLGKECDSTW